MAPKKYRKKEDVLVWKWEGDYSLIKEIGEVLKEYKHLKVGVSSDPTCLYASTTQSDEHDEFTSTDFIRVGEYVVFDINNELRPIACYNEEWLNKKYVEM